MSKDAVHRELVAAQSECAGHVAVNGEAVLLGQFAAQIVRPLLRDVHAGDRPVGPMVTAVAQVTVEITAANVVGVREVIIGCGDDGEAAALAIGARRRLQRGPGRGAAGGHRRHARKSRQTGSGRGEELTAPGIRSLRDLF